jgi:hypothetical protein
MGAVIANFLVRTSPKTFTNDTPNPGTCDEHGAQYVHTGGAVQSKTLASGVTTDTSSTPVAGMPGNKTFWAEISGTGAVSVTVTIFGNRTNSTSGGVLLATISLSGTGSDTDAAAVSTAAYPYYYVTTASISGTGATVGVYAFY